MHIVITFINKLKKLSFSHNYTRAILFLAILIVGGAALMYFFEKESNSQFLTIGDGFWWAISTVTTVGYGDRYPMTSAGRLLAAVVMVGGIGSFGFIAGSILEDFIEKGRGRMNIKFKDHYVICSYNYKVESIVMEIRKELPDCRIVLVADREENPMINREGVSFVRGDSTREAVLEMANVSKAKTVIVLADDKVDDQFTDAHSVLTALAVKELNPSCKVVAESLNPENTNHMTHAGADEIICIGDISAKLISRSSIHKGMTNLIHDLMTSNSGNELYSQETPDFLVNRAFENASSELRKRGAILIGVYKNGTMTSNPPSDFILGQGEHVIYIAPNQVL